MPTPAPPAGQTGTFVYRNWQGHERHLRVRDCPNPAVARTALEAENCLATSVRWEPRR